MKRRTLLAAVATAGASAPSAAAAQTNESDDPDCGETEQIPVVKSGDEVVATREVPAAWWEQVERSRSAVDEVAADYENEPWFVGAATTDGERELCGHSAFVVVVWATDVEAARAALPAEREGVPVRVEEGAPASITPAAGDERDGDLGAGGAEAASVDASDADGNETDAAPNDSDEDADSSDSPLPGFGVPAALAALAGAAARLVTDASEE